MHGCARIRMATKGGTGMSKGFGKNGEAATCSISISADRTRVFIYLGGAEPGERHCHVWTPPVLQGENRFETAVELAVMYPAFSLRYTDRWP